MGQTLPYSSAVVVTSQRFLADDLRQFLNRVGIPFVHTPTDLVQANKLLGDDLEALALIHCDEIGGSAQILLEDLSIDSKSRLRPLVLLLDDDCSELRPMADELQTAVVLDAGDWQSSLAEHLAELPSRSISSISLQERYRAARFLRNSDEYQDAESILVELLDELPDCVAIALDLADLFREQQRLDEALAILQDLTDAGESHAGTWHSLALCYEMKQKWPRAIEHWQTALAKNPHHSYRQLKLADSLREAGRLDEAQFHYRQLLQENLRTQPAILGLLKCLLSLGDLSLVLDEWRGLMSPTELASHCNIFAAALLRADKFTEAVASLRFAIACLKDEPTIAAKLIYNLGVIWSGEQDLLKSYLSFGLASLLDPESAKARSNWEVAQQKAKCDLPKLTAHQAVDWYLSAEFPQWGGQDIGLAGADSQQSLSI